MGLNVPSRSADTVWSEAVDPGNKGVCGGETGNRTKIDTSMNNGRKEQVRAGRVRELGGT